MRVLLITVGTSAITNTGIGKAAGNPPGRGDNRALLAQVSLYLDFPENQKSIGRNKELFDALLAGHRAFWSADSAYIRDLRNRRQTSAELVSTDVGLRIGNAFRPDKVVLLHSATNEGRIAAMLNQRIMQEHWNALGVEIQEIAGLDENLLQVDENLRQCLDVQIRLGADDEVILNFTGGYKGAIPFYTILAQQRGWKLFNLHEERKEPEILQLPPLGNPGAEDPRISFWQPMDLGE